MTDTAAPPGPAQQPRQRRPWTLSARLMVTVIGSVAVILALVALILSVSLGGILQRNLDDRLRNMGEGRIEVRASQTAAEVLQRGRQAEGFLLVLNTGIGSVTGAYVNGDDEIVTLTADQILAVLDGTPRSPGDRGNGRGPGAIASITIPDVGSYRMLMLNGPNTQAFAVIGLPLSEVSATITDVLTTVVLVTGGGLILLSVAIAMTIRAGLRPLRAIAQTASRVAHLPMSTGSVSIPERVSAEESDPRTEVGRVGASLNTLLDHVDSSLAARQQNEERMRQFVADASHELRTPLASIRGYSELSLRDKTLTDTTESSLERIQAQSLRMTTLVEDLLLLARLDEGTELVYSEVDLSALAVEALSDARVAGQDHRWVLALDDEPVLVAGDSARLHQVAANLLANARTHTPDGTEVTLEVTRDGSQAVMRVHDTGPGIDPAIADELFERFSRADSSRARKTGGSGLGLSIARAIVNAHHGTIGVTSEPGHTVFEVRLPAKPSTLPDLAEPADAATHTTSG